MKLGKLPFEYLSDILEKIPEYDSRVALGAYPGEDAALIDIGEKYLVVTTDPITFATDQIGWYAVNVNANDIAATGGIPKWMIANLLLPKGTSKKDVDTIFSQLIEACNEFDIKLVGGHTEITNSVNTPVIMGGMLGEVDKGKEVRSSGAMKNDSIIITKRIPIEGSAILATEKESLLISKNISKNNINSAKKLLMNPGISIVQDAQIAMNAAPIHAMHDATEGGVAQGLTELAKASNLGMLINVDKVPLINSSKDFWEALDLNPLGVISSGTLIISVSQQNTSTVIKALNNKGIEASEIGVMKENEYGLKMSSNGNIYDLPKFDQDEITKVLE